MSMLFLQLSQDGHEARAWLQAAQEFTDLGIQSLEQLKGQSAGAACVVFIPSSRCLFTTVNASTQQLRQAGQSLAWLIEEQTGEDAENLHIVASASQAGDQASLLAINRQTLQDLLQKMQGSGFRVTAVLPDLFLLPVPDNEHREWRLQAMPDRHLALRTGVFSGAVLERELLLPMLNAAVQEENARPPASLVVSTELPADLQADVQEWAASLQPSLQVSLLQTEDADIGKILREVPDWTRHPANLLQGSFAASRRFSLPYGLRMAAIFMAAAFALQLLSEWMNYGYYRYQARKTEAAAIALYKQMYPEERRIVNLRRQFKAHMNDQGSASTVLPALTRIAESLQGSGLNTQRVDFNNGVLTLDVDARALGELDSFRQKLEGQGFRSEIVSANAQGSAIRGRLRVEGGA